MSKSKGKSDRKSRTKKTTIPVVDVKMAAANDKVEFADPVDAPNLKWSIPKHSRE